jgi:cytidyltransferase-like protein
MKTIVLVTGGFDPLHSGHIAYFQAARELGDHLIVGLNSDEWLTRKKGRAFMPISERLGIVGNLRMVDATIVYDDSDNHSIEAIRQVRDRYPDCRIIFANGGDRTKTNIPEMDCGVEGVEFRFGVGGTRKANSSSWILEDWKAPKTPRPWGYYRVLHEVPGCKVKELTVSPGASLSMQRHQERAEFWLVSEGTATVYTINVSTDAELNGVFQRHEFLHIAPNEWHQLINEQPHPLKIVEIQYGDRCEEEDIERNQQVRWG